MRSLVKCYKIISLLNCLGNLLENVVAEKLLLFYETRLKLHKDQISARKNRYAIDIMAILTKKLHKSKEKKKVARVLFIDIKSVFHYISRVKLA